MAEVHVIGQISEAKDFPEGHLFCKWYFQYGNNWKLISGKAKGQSQVTHSPFDETKSTWSFPIDIHFATAGIQGWPKIYIEVYHLDWLGRAHLFGYGLVTVPCGPGSHSIDCYTWRPLGSARDRFVRFFLGGGPQLRHSDLVFSPTERYKLSTEAMGVVSFDLNVVLRNFTNYGVEY
ncbi:B9 domain-containing protein 2-like [Cylas formicarius]|uniref:B9 domain-containing protein 2-like n=1 Tax=Cylas formicarius TaxID=197179 RepID=UPI002958846C|nr:B9 domain-containing protein 2-like [Cylas formicarius]